MHMRQPIRYQSTLPKPRLFVSVPQSNVLPRRIAQGVFFVDNKVNGGGNDVLPSTNTLANLQITHAVVDRGADLPPSCGMKVLFVGPHDPLSKIVAWMRAVRQLGAHIVVSDFAAAAGYLVVELGLTPRSAWLRIARGLPPIGDLVLSRLSALAFVHSQKEKENGLACIPESASDGGLGNCEGFSVTPQVRRGHQRMRMRAESGLKHVIVI